MTQCLKRKHADSTEADSRKRLLNELAFSELPHFGMPIGTMSSTPVVDNSMDIEPTEFPPYATATVPQQHPLGYGGSMEAVAPSAIPSGPPRQPTPMVPPSSHHGSSICFYRATL
ncbi:hypothetical protein H4R33_005031 [Dimargaris cristalligena]|nr:hypothetical protein H4R33_005031 [Dimargaris cristalligena]